MHRGPLLCGRRRSHVLRMPEVLYNPLAMPCQPGTTRKLGDYPISGEPRSSSDMIRWRVKMGDGWQGT